jgi:hypothetical protein
MPSLTSTEIRCTNVRNISVQFCTNHFLTFILRAKRSLHVHWLTSCRRSALPYKALNNIASECSPFTIPVSTKANRHIKENSVPSSWLLVCTISDTILQEWRTKGQQGNSNMPMQDTSSQSLSKIACFYAAPVPGIAVHSYTRTLAPIFIP